MTTFARKYDFSVLLTNKFSRAINFRDFRVDLKLAKINIR